MFELFAAALGGLTLAWMASHDNRPWPRSWAIAFLSFCLLAASSRADEPIAFEGLDEMPISWNTWASRDAATASAEATRLLAAADIGPIAWGSWASCECRGAAETCPCKTDVGECPCPKSAEPKTLTVPPGGPAKTPLAPAPIVEKSRQGKRYVWSRNLGAWLEIDESACSGSSFFGGISSSCSGDSCGSFSRGPFRRRR